MIETMAAAIRSPVSVWREYSRPQSRIGRYRRSNPPSPAVPVLLMLCSPA